MRWLGLRRNEGHGGDVLKVKTFNSKQKLCGIFQVVSVGLAGLAAGASYRSGVAALVITAFVYSFQSALEGPKVRYTHCHAVERSDLTGVGMSRYTILYARRPLSDASGYALHFDVAFIIKVLLVSLVNYGPPVYP